MNIATYGVANAMGKNGSALKIRWAIQKDIVEGRLEPGERLPTHVELADRFGVSNVTIQNALNQLSSDGFIDVRPRVGSFVVERPPHLHNVGLVFPFDPATRGEQFNWSKYYQALSNAARELQQGLDRRIMMFHRIDAHTDSEDFRRLLRHIDQHQLAGLVFAGPPYMVEDTPICQAPHMPRVELSSAKDAPWPVLRHDNQQWYERALDRLVREGHRRIAVLINRFRHNEFFNDRQLNQLLAQRDLYCPPEWRQAAEWHDPEAARHVVQLLMKGDKNERPDALLVTDDNLIEGVSRGIMACGLRAPQDVRVIARMNFPLPSHPTLPVKMLGYHWQNILSRAVDLIDEQRAGALKKKVFKVHAEWHESTHSPPSTMADNTAL